MLVLSGDWAEIAGYFDVQKIADSSCRLGADTRPTFPVVQVRNRNQCTYAAVAELADAPA
jgi:hypothetical protein